MIPAPAAKENDTAAAPVFALLGYVVGLAGITALGAFVALNGWALRPRGGPGDALTAGLVNLAWLVLFALQHSGMARAGFKDWLTRRLPSRFERPLYVLLSGMLGITLPVVWQPLPGDHAWRDEWWLLGVSAAGALLVGVCGLRTDQASFLGLRAPVAAEPLRVDGPYRLVRHPMMLGVLLFLWGQPFMPPELFMLNLGLTAYIAVAIPLEERELVRQYGDAYRRYRERVPVLLPWPR